MKEKSILHLTLSNKPFEVMVTGEKFLEFRKPSDWIKSRLVGKGYDLVKFVNGYGADKPYFIAEYLCYTEAEKDLSTVYSNGLRVESERGDFVIILGHVIEKGNLK
ncbi:MAG: hypothetical protein ABJG33_04925 [Balneola sp.]